MPYLDLVARWIWQTTGRTIDQHAVDPVPAAAHLPASADALRLAREVLLNAVDEFRTQLINGDDLTGSATVLANTLSEITEHVNDYEGARIHLDKLINDPDRTVYVATNPVQPVHRRYVNPGDTVLIVLPHSTYLRQQQIAGRAVRAQIHKSDVELDPAEYPGPVRLSHGIAGIYRDPVEDRLYILRATGERRISRR
ncbi:hypothetical protein [Actinoplanes regularis]|uniref:Uncharacterized protein n=1 Tax=Actinoplanes regularis TaxID=52697 RepID=A0A239IXS3_9ACTN|nr:hypothetical protein [Actinoplanes regularis]GIE91627.1 hypothetical protein Are01nite_81070 [Actinoplanes regularis]SNS98427.1 hypothetical protein SAMN06264365_13167 [Actinoplanes regularis]